MKTVMCFGTFDLLHLGHLNYLKQAKLHGGKLVVVIARDKTKADQEKQPIFQEHERQELIQSLEVVDQAVLGHLGNHYKIIEEIQPDVIALGYDHPISIENLQSALAQRNLFPKIIRAEPYRADSQKSTILKETIFKTN